MSTTRAAAPGTRFARRSGLARGASTGLIAALLLGGCATSSDTGTDPGPAAASPTERSGDSKQRARRDRSSLIAPSQSAGPSSTGTGAGEGGSAPVPRGSEDWRVRTPGAGTIAGYTTAVSGSEGTPVDLKVSTTAPRYRVSAFRLGAYKGGTGTEVWRSGSLPGREQAAPVFRPVVTRTVVAPWKVSLSVDTAGWRPGYYVFKLRSSRGREVLVPYVVTSESSAGTVALVAPVTTWQAYNEWGGYSLYDGPGGARSHAVSFDRPYNGATGANDFRTAALPIIVQAEKLGIELSYFTNVDLHTTPGILDDARGYVSMGHDEYWTTTMRDVVTRARDAGTNLAFLGANTMYWRVRLEDSARVVVGYRSDAWADPLHDRRSEETTARFRDAPAAHPEQDLVGMMYECFPIDDDYVVVSPQWWGFRGTGVRHGDRIPGLVGPEADRVYPGSSLPRPMQILSHTPYSCGGVATVAESVYYTTPSGSGVFSAGTLRWGCSLVDRCERPLGDVTRKFVRAVTENLLRGFAAGPVGRRHPARDNVDRFDLSPVNAVSAS